MGLRNHSAVLVVVGTTMVLTATSALAVENSQPNPSNVKTVPITVKLEGPQDYPPGAAARGEQGTALLAISSEDGVLKAKPLMSSGFADLDAAAADIAVQTYRVSTTPDVKIIAVVWSLKLSQDKPSQMQPPSGP